MSEQIELFDAGFEHAKRLIGEGRVVLDKGDWHSVNPGTEATDAYISEYGYEAYGLWHLGIRADDSRETKEAYAFPYGDFENVHRAGLKAAEERARQYDYEQIRAAAQQLLDLLPPEE